MSKLIFVCLVEGTKQKPPDPKLWLHTALDCDLLVVFCSIVGSTEYILDIAGIVGWALGLGREAPHKQFERGEWDDPD